MSAPGHTDPSFQQTLRKHGYKKDSDAKNTYTHPEHGTGVELDGPNWHHHYHKEDGGQTIGKGKSLGSFARHMEGFHGTQHSEPINTQFTEQEKQWLGLESTQVVQMGEKPVKVRGPKHTWELQHKEEGDPMPGTKYRRGSKLPNGGTVLGTNDKDTLVGVHHPDTQVVQEFPAERFKNLFGKHLKEHA